MGFSHAPDDKKRTGPLNLYKKWEVPVSEIREIKVSSLADGFFLFKHPSHDPKDKDRCDWLIEINYSTEFIYLFKKYCTKNPNVFQFGTEDWEMWNTQKKGIFSKYRTRINKIIFSEGKIINGETLKREKKHFGKIIAPDNAIGAQTRPESAMVTNFNPPQRTHQSRATPNWKQIKQSARERAAPMYESPPADDWQTRRKLSANKKSEREVKALPVSNIKINQPSYSQAPKKSELTRPKTDYKSVPVGQHTDITRQLGNLMNPGGGPPRGLRVSREAEATTDYRTPANKYGGVAIMPGMMPMGHQPNYAEHSSSKPPPLAPKPKPKTKPRFKKCKAEYDYHANDADELNMITGDEFEILKDDGSGWITVKDRMGNTGQVPKNHTDAE